MMKLLILLSILFSTSVFSTQIVYVETELDTDKNGIKDRIYTRITKPNSSKKLSTIFKISPYSLGGNSDVFHDVDMDYLPQDDRKVKSHLNKHISNKQKSRFDIKVFKETYATINSDSIGTGRSTGCPSVGDMNETLAAKAVIDWLNGKAKAYDSIIGGKEVIASWANGNVGMIGVSYNGTLPTMVATTGVQGLKAIVPIAAISSWYNYYRSNGLVVNPGGYIGEDADSLGKYIVRSGKCTDEINLITKNMARENGDDTKFWQARDYVALAKNIKAATYIIHGQKDWNVKQKHAIDLWQALEPSVDKRMFLHSGGHSYPWSNSIRSKVQKWFDLHLYGKNIGEITDTAIEVSMNNGGLLKQNSWPHEKTSIKRFYFNSTESLSPTNQDTNIRIIDQGRKVEINSLINSIGSSSTDRAVFLQDPLKRETLISGNTTVSLKLSLINRSAANLSVVLIDYDKRNRGTIITRGWADPQNYNSLEQGELLTKGQFYKMKFELEPKQYLVKKGHRIGVLIASTDYHFTLRPKVGTEIEFQMDSDSYIDIFLGVL